jgi:hypothetical protein
MSDSTPFVMRIQINNQALRQLFAELDVLKNRIQEEGRTEELIVQMMRLKNLVMCLQDDYDVILKQWQENILRSMMNEPK